MVIQNSSDARSLPSATVDFILLKDIAPCLPSREHHRLWRSSDASGGREGGAIGTVPADMRESGSIAYVLIPFAWDLRVLL